MALTPDEEKKLREQIRSELSKRETRIRQNDEKEQSERLTQLEARLRQQIIEEEEEKFFTERGYVKHTNRHGGVEWLMPEEAQKRSQRRRSNKKKPSRRRATRNQTIKQLVVSIVMIVFAAAVFMFLLKYRTANASKTTGAVFISTDVPGAQLYINAAEKRQFQTPDTLAGISPGAYFVSVYKDGFTAWPPMQRITVEAGKVAAVEFQLKNTGLLGKVEIESNLPDFDLYIDGILQQPAHLDLFGFDIPVGYHVITVVKDGYIGLPAHQRVLVKTGEITRVKFHFEKSTENGYLEVTSNNSSAYLFLNDRFSGLKANGNPIPIPAGVYEVRLRQNGFQSLPPMELVRISPGEKKALSFNLQPESVQDTVQIITKNPGAGIIIDGHWQPFITPVLDLALSEGVHFLNLMRDHQLYSEKEVQLDVEKLEDKVIVLDF